MYHNIKKSKSNLCVWSLVQTLYPNAGKGIFKARIIVVVCFAFFTISTARSATFVVNSTQDAPDLFPGNGSCQTITIAQCTLRAAITEANSLAGDNTITLPTGTYTVTLAAIGEDANAGGDKAITTSKTSAVRLSRRRPAT